MDLWNSPPLYLAHFLRADVAFLTCSDFLRAVWPWPRGQRSTPRRGHIRVLWRSSAGSDHRHQCPLKGNTSKVLLAQRRSVSQPVARVARPVDSSGRDDGCNAETRDSSKGTCDPWQEWYRRRLGFRRCVRGGGASGGWGWSPLIGSYRRRVLATSGRESWGWWPRNEPPAAVRGTAEGGKGLGWHRRGPWLPRRACSRTHPGVGVPGNQRRNKYSL